MVTMFNIVTMYDSETTRFTKAIKITPEDLEWIKKNKKKKSAAGFLEYVIAEFRKPNLFKKKK